MTAGVEDRTGVEDGATIVIRATAPGASGGRVCFGEVETAVLTAC